MAHQDYSEICPIFNEGTEKELLIKKIPTSSTISVCFGNIPFGREVVLIEAFAMTGVRSTASLSTTATCNIGIFKNTLSVQLGSIHISQSTFAVSTVDLIPSTITGEVTSSVAFTSTDLLCLAMTEKSTSVNTYYADVIIRYRDA